MTDILDPERHLAVFDPNTWGNRRVSIIGCGASGSHLAQEIARLGVRDLHLWDHDNVEGHNIANQLYPMAAIGQPKAEICRALLRAGTGIDPVAHGICEGEEDPENALGDVVFLCVDSMAARREIVSNQLRMNAGTQLVIDTRMGAEELRVYNFCPHKLFSLRDWEATLTDDSETMENACQARTTIGGTAATLAGLATHVFLQWCRHEVFKDAAYQPPPFEIMMMLRPPMIITR